MTDRAALFLLLNLVFWSIPESATGQSASYFMLVYSAGTSWDKALPYEEQPALESHHEYLKQLYTDDLLVIGGSVENTSNADVGMYLLRVGSLEEANRLATQDPGVQNRLLRVKTIPWRVSMSSVRFVRRKFEEKFEDPDASFRIRRIDPNSSLNLED